MDPANSFYSEAMLPKGCEKGSNELLIWITLLSSLDYIRDVDALWAAGKAAYEDKDKSRIYNPNDKRIESLSDLQKVLIESKIAQRKDKDTKIWRTVLRSIRDTMKGNIKSFIVDNCSSDAVILYFNIGIKYKKMFPVLSGPKILATWIRLLNKYGGMKLNRLNEVPLPVDVHVARATVFTVCDTDNETSDISSEKENIDLFWEEIAKGMTEFTKQDFDECLMNLSRYGCSSCRGGICAKREECSVSAYCRAIKRNMSVSQGEDGIKV